MSAVRMCDRCGRVFSEREIGWSSGVINTTTRGDHGRPITVSDNQDACKDCVEAAVPQPRLMVEAAKSDRQDLAD